MTDEIQELKNALFSHYLLKDHDASRVDQMHKGCIVPGNMYDLGGSNILGQRHPLYLKSLVESMDAPTELSQAEAMTTLLPTIEFVQSRLAIEHADYPFINILQLSKSNQHFWKQTGFKIDPSLETQVIPLVFNTAIIFSKNEVLNSPKYIPFLSTIYQNKITKLFKEQNFLDHDGRVDDISKKLSSHTKKVNGLIVTLKKESSNLDRFRFVNKSSEEAELHFPVYITDQQIDDIFKLLKQ